VVFADPEDDEDGEPGGTRHQETSSPSVIIGKRLMTVRLRYALLLAIAAVPLLDVGEIKPAPLGVAIVLFAVHALLSLVTRSFERFWPRDVLSAALWLGCFVVAGVFVVTLLALDVAPPMTPDGHRVMAIGQVMVGIVVGGALGTGVAVFGSLRSRARDRRRERLVLHLFGALLVVAVVVHRA
jgi:hypothetical protein